MKRLLFAAMFAVSLFAQTSALAPVPKQQPLGNGGQILPGSCLYVYSAGSTTPQDTYNNSILTVKNQNPIVLDAYGRAPAIYWNGTAIKMTLANKVQNACPGSPGTVIWSQDNITDAALALKTALATASGAGLIGYELTGTSTLRTVQAKLQESISVLDFGAIGNDSHDDTSSIQQCIDYSSANRASCFVPPGIYKITGSGLSITSGQPSLYGLQSEGEGAPVLKYYGTGAALSIGNGTDRLFAINLTNVGIAAANGVTAAYGINVQDTSGGEWNGVTIGGGATSGIFTKALRFSDSGLINMHHLVISNQSYTASTTGILMDDFISFGNGTITLDVSDMANLEKTFELRECASCKFSKFYVENSKYAVYVDNTTFTANLNNIIFDNGEINTSGSGAPSHLLLSVTGAAAKDILVDQLHFTNNRFFLSGGVTSPMVFAISGSATAASHVNLYLDNNAWTGANTSMITSNSAKVKAQFGPQYAVDNGGSGLRTPDCTGTCTGVNDPYAQDTANAQLKKTDAAGNDTAASYTTLGTVSIGASPTAINSYKVFSASLDFAAPTVPGCDTALALTAPAAVANSAPLFYSPPVTVPPGPTDMFFYAWVQTNGAIAAKWCQFDGTPTDPDGAGATYTVSVVQ